MPGLLQCPLPNKAFPLLMERTTLRTSTILVSTSERTEWFESKDAIPPSLRKQLEDSLNSPNSFTFLLADRNGRQELMNALDGRPSALTRRYTSRESGEPGVEAVASLLATSGPVTKWNNDGIGIVPMVKRLVIGFSLAFSVVLFLLTAKVLSR